MLLNNVSFVANEGAEFNPIFPNSDGWTCTIGYQGYEIEVPFYMGKGHNGEEPKMEDVLDCLFTDSFANEVDFDYWCAEFGYDSDSIKALNTYNKCKELGKKLEQLFNEDFEVIQEELRELVG